MNVGVVSFLFGFGGRINRARFWLALLLYATASALTVLFAVLVAPDTVFRDLFAVVTLVILVSAVAIGVKRLHDRDRSGWWLVAFYGLPGVLGAIGRTLGVPIVFEMASFVISLWALIELGVMPGTPGANRYGSDPRARSAPRMF